MHMEADGTVLEPNPTGSVFVNTPGRCDIQIEGELDVQLDRFGRSTGRGVGSGEGCIGGLHRKPVSAQSLHISPTLRPSIAGSAYVCPHSAEEPWITRYPFTEGLTLADTEAMGTVDPAPQGEVMTMQEMWDDVEKLFEKLTGKALRSKGKTSLDDCKAQIAKLQQPADADAAPAPTKRSAGAKTKSFAMDMLHCVKLLGGVAAQGGSMVRASRQRGVYRSFRRADVY